MPPRYQPRYTPEPYYSPYYPPYPARRRKPAKTNRKERSMSFCPHCGKQLPQGLFDQGGHKKPAHAPRLSPAIGYAFIGLFVLLLILSSIQP